MKLESFASRDDLLTLINTVASIDQRLEQLEKQRINASDIKTRTNTLFRTGAYEQERPPCEVPFHLQLAENVSSITGLREAVLTKHKAFKYTWLFLLFLGIGATVWFTSATINEYLDEPIVTRVTLQTQSTYEFPPIVLCNEAWFDTNKAIELGLSIDGLKYSLYYSDAFAASSGPFSANVSLARNEFLDFYKKNNFKNLADYYNAISVDMQPQETWDDFYNASSPSYLSQIGTPAPKKVFSFGYVMCQVFSVQPVESGLSVFLIPEGIVLKSGDQTRGLLGPVNPGWKAYTSTELSSSLPLLLQNNKNTYLKIKAQKFIALNQRNAPCVSKKENENYSFATCISHCANQAFKQALKCDALWDLSLVENDKRGPTDFCNFAGLILFNLSDPNYFYTQIKGPCFKKCAPECERMLFDATVEGEDQLPPESIAAAGRLNMSIIRLIIYHDAMKQGGIVTIREKASYSFTELANNVGGTLGLFVGGTLFTLVQLVLFLVRYACDKEIRSDKVQNISVA